MKNTLKVASVIMTAAMLLCSCSEKQQTKTDALISSIVNDAAAGETTSANVNTTVPAAKPESLSAQDTSAPAAGKSSGEVDMDLTKMNSTMIYSIIYDMLINPQDYYGKSIIVDGYFDTMFNDKLNVRYYYIVVPDATACCVQGLEFMLPKDKKYPEDYPSVKENMRIKGVLDRYEEEGQLYLYINAEYVKKI